MQELMITVGIFAILAGMVLGLGVQARSEHATTTGYQRDLVACRATLQQVESDLRHARRLVRAGRAVVVRGRLGDVEYRVEDDGLWRLAKDGRRRLARCVTGFELSSAGSLARVAIELGSRSRHRAGRRARITTQVTMRNGDR